MATIIDTITINKLEISTLIGTYPFERQMKQKLFVTIQFSVNAAHIAQTDDITNAVDYEKLSQSIIQFGIDTQYYLIETFAEKLSQHLFELYPLSWVQLEITKPAAIKNAQGVTIKLERSHD